MIFLSLHYGGPHANPAKRVVWGEGGTTEWSGCPPSGGRSGVEFVPTRRRRRRLKRTGATAPVLTGAWGRQPPTSECRYIPAHCLPLPTAHIIRNKEPIALWPPTQFHRSTFTMNILSYDTFHHIAFFHFLMIIAALI